MARGKHSSGGIFAGLSFKGLFSAPKGRHGPGRTKQAVGRGRSTAKYPGVHVGPRQGLDGKIQPGYSTHRGRGISTRVQMRSRSGGQVHSGYGRFAGIRHFGWHRPPTFGG